MADAKISALTAATTPLAGTEVLPIVQSGTTKKVSVANLTAGRVVGMLRGNIEGAYDGAAPSTSSVPILRVNEGGAISLWAGGQAYTKMWLQAIQDDGSNNLKQLALQPLGGGVGVGGDLTLDTGNLVIGTSGKGIDFSANTPAAGMTSQLLNWYEEGTWTVTLTPGTSGTIGLYSTFDVCQYTRIGRMMFVSGQIKIISTSSPVGTYVRMSLPSTIADLPEIAGRMGTGVLKVNTVLAATANEGANYIDIQSAASGFAVDEIIAFSFSYVTA